MRLALTGVLPVSDATYAGMVTQGSPESIHGNAIMSGLTTSEGTFANLRGAAANAVVTTNLLNSVGTAPANANAAASGLTANDAINNLQSGNFQFPNGFDASTRFFILDTTPLSSTVGDSTTVTLIDAANSDVGTLTLNLVASNWTLSPANTTNTALATVTYTSGQGTLAQKQGAVTFSLADFAGAGNPSLASGIRLSSGFLDPVVVGIFSMSGSFPPLPPPPTPVNILFVGNSYTHGSIPAVISYNNAAIVDANGTGYGGVPGIFKQLTVDAGLNYNVTIEAVSSQSLAWHLSNKTSIIFQSGWNKVFLQEQSTRPLPTSRGGNPTSFRNAANSLEQGIRGVNPFADVYLYETFPRADVTYPAGQAYSGEPIETMGNDLHDGYYGALALNPNFSGVSPAGDAWLRAIVGGVADRNPYDGIEVGKVSLWASDNHHASIYGSYLNALVHFGSATGRDPRTLGYEKAAIDLGISSAFATSLQQVAFETLNNAPPTISYVVNRQVFYNRSTNSSFGNGTGNPVTAIDSTKSALLPGQVASFANYTNYVRGLNGLIVDIANPSGTITAADFQLATWKGISVGGFTPLAAVPTITTIAGGGIANTTRIKIEFADNAIRNTWLRVTLLANANTGLASNDVFYFGNAVGDVGQGNFGSPTIVRTDTTDLQFVRNNLSYAINSALVTNIYDLNKDGQVNPIDMSIVQQNQARSLIRFFTAPVSLQSAIVPSIYGFSGLSAQVSFGTSLIPTTSSNVSTASSGIAISSYRSLKLANVNAPTVTLATDAIASLPTSKLQMEIRTPITESIASIDGYFATL